MRTTNRTLFVIIGLVTGVAAASPLGQADAPEGTNCTILGNQICEFFCEKGDKIYVSAHGVGPVAVHAACGGEGAGCVGVNDCDDQSDGTTEAGEGICQTASGVMTATCSAEQP